MSRLSTVARRGMCILTTALVAATAATCKCIYKMPMYLQLVVSCEKGIYTHTYTHTHTATDTSVHLCNDKFMLNAEVSLRYRA